MTQHSVINLDSESSILVLHQSDWLSPYATEMLWAVAVADLPVEPTAEHQSSFENIDPNV